MPALIISGVNPTTGETWTDAASAWLRDARVDSQTAHVASTVWATTIDRPGSETTDAGSYVTGTAVQVGAVDPDVGRSRNHDNEENRPRLHPGDIQKIAVAVVELLGETR